jgi:Protein of unknown function (DUF2489)
MTPEQEVARKKQLVSAAKALLSLQVGISVGCLRVSKVLYWLGFQDQLPYQVFKQFNQATVGLPVGNERLLWSHSALLEQDEKLSKIENEFRPKLLQACVAIIERYG